MDRATTLAAFEDAASRALALPIAPDWRPSLQNNLAVCLGFARDLLAFELPDDVEPAAVFDAFDDGAP